MPKKLKRVLSVLLAIILLAGVIGCGQNNQPSPAQTQEKATEAPGTTAAATEAATTAAAETTTAATTAAASAKKQEQATVTTEPPPKPSKYQQAPMLDSKGLPPVDERLPEDPLVVRPYEKVGVYGGTWRQTVEVGLRIHAMAGLGFYDGRGFLVWNEDKTQIIPNLASKVELSADGTTYTFTLRKGLKWSDGEPMTTDDVLFWFEAVETNPTLNPGYENATIKIIRVDVVDDVTFSFVYNAPNPMQYYSFASYQWTVQFLPKHYLSQFHPGYAKDAESKASAAGFDNWNGYFNDRNDYMINPDRPTMSPWVLQNEGAAASQLFYERNPYYWAVDTAGNQLPYIDSCIINVVQSPDMVRMKAIAGEFELTSAGIINSFIDYPLFAENMGSGNYTVRLSEFAEPNAMNIHVNIAHKDPDVRAVFGNVKFRQALSYSLNRDKIIATNFTVGPIKSVKRNFSPYPGSPYFDEKWSSAYTEYDIGKAIALLDEIGLGETNAQGFRLLPNGNELTMIIDVPTFDPSWIDVGIMIADCFKEVGINASANSLDPSLWGERKLANDFDCTIFTGGGGFATMSLGDINDYTGYRGADWPNTFQQGFIVNREAKEGEIEMEVPPEIERLWELGRAIVTEPDEVKQETLLKEVFQIHKDNLYILGISTRPPAPYLVKNNMKNVPPLDVDWAFGCTGHGRPAQYFIED